MMTLASELVSTALRGIVEKVSRLQSNHWPHSFCITSSLTWQGKSIQVGKPVTHAISYFYIFLLFRPVAWLFHTTGRNLLLIWCRKSGDRRDDIMCAMVKTCQKSAVIFHRKGCSSPITKLYIVWINTDCSRGKDAHYDGGVTIPYPIRSGRSWCNLTAWDPFDGIMSQLEFCTSKIQWPPFSPYLHSHVFNECSHVLRQSNIIS